MCLFHNSGFHSHHDINTIQVVKEIEAVFPIAVLLLPACYDGSQPKGMSLLSGLSKTFGGSFYFFGGPELILLSHGSFFSVADFRTYVFGHSWSPSVAAWIAEPT